MYVKAIVACHLQIKYNGGKFEKRVFQAVNFVLFGVTNCRNSQSKIYSLQSERSSLWNRTKYHKTEERNGINMKLKLGVIGTGMAWERLHFPAIKELSDKYEIIAVCNKTIEKAQNFAKSINLPQDRVYSDHKEMLKRTDIDVYDVLVPISENYEIAKDVLSAGKNLIAEKPLAATIEGAKELIDLKNQRNLKVMVAENYRYEECYTIIKEVITGGKIGDIAYFILNTAADFEADMITDTFAAKEWRQHPTVAGGIFLDGSIHDIALMRFLFGDVDRVEAFSKPQNKDFCPYQNINSILKFKSGAIGSYSFYSVGKELQKPPIGLRIYGTLGEIYLESKESGTVSINCKDGFSEQRSFTPQRGYYNELLNYYDGNIVSTPEKELGDIELIFNILRKIES
jgi:predicted dehydrogenase